MKPSIGRIVHFVGNGMTAESAHYPAVITHVHSPTCVNLLVHPKGMPLDDSNSGIKTSVVLSENGDIYSWHWPERSE